MFNALFSKIAAGIVVPMIFILHAAGYHLVENPIPDYSLDISHLSSRVASLEHSHGSLSTPLGSTNSVGQPVAIFSTSLQSQITSSQTTMTLVSATYNNGATTLASSSYDFIIDQGTASQEFVSADCNATICTNMTRGLDWMNGTTSIPTLQFQHRRGASVQITDAPLLLKLYSLSSGAQSYTTIPKYSPSISTSTIAANRQDFASAGLVADTAFAGAGVINATTNSNGVVQIATTIQSASSTALGSSGATLTIPASSATSTFNAATAGLRVVVTQNNGKIDSNFLGSLPIASSTTFTSGIPLLNIGKNIFIATSTQVFTVPSGFTFLDVQCVGGGGGGGSTGSSQNFSSAGGGGSGAYIRSLVNLTGVSTVTITVGSGGAGGATGSSGNSGSAGGNTSFGAYLIANGGQGGTNTNSVSETFSAGGAGGVASSTASTTIMSVSGGIGSYGYAASATGNIVAYGGNGGTSYFGGGASGSYINSGVVAGNNALVWGSGGSGAAGLSGTSVVGGNGQYGACIIIY